MKHINKLYKPLIQSYDCSSRNENFNTQTEIDYGNIVGMSKVISPKYTTLKKVSSSERNAFYVHSAKNKLPGH